MKRKKLKLDEIKVKSFIVHDENAINKKTVLGGEKWTGNCLSILYTCADGCDAQSIPLNECSGLVCGGASLAVGVTCFFIWD